ncbi:hypothetical protein [Flavobacterium sp. PL002]|uniref:hypothetical protein n=1 Tax=Flavobacterium sp. PL002 TaxID=1897058 RepID=UPI0017881791|nr:hypothetical protein [Flavobacterium sp. PL002]MBE0393344.1 hypothetical protein [Flavobacterium sp. PL002]
MYYYYYYDSSVQLNFKFLDEDENTINKSEQISLIDFENLITCINELNKCIIENSTDGKTYDGKTHSLILKKISYNSPLELSVIVSLSASIIGIPLLIIKCIEIINNIIKGNENHKYNIEKQKLEIEKQKLEIEKLKLDNKEKSKNRIEISDEKIESIFAQIILSKSFDKIVRKWKNLPFKKIKYEVQFRKDNAAENSDR